MRGKFKSNRFDAWEPNRPGVVPAAAGAVPCEAFILCAMQRSSDPDSTENHFADDFPHLEAGKLTR
ncbi:hypothetical protein [Sphingomonas sp. MS122]|uniref:hypothetical protein n=1 Tax=Sphingomonas sp. MS122 TaxID=3412683 RepID=UPI003C2E849E